MSITGEITRINNNIFAAYTAAQNKGAVLPQACNSANLAAAIGSIDTGVPTESLLYNQMNQQAGKYISQVVYDPSDYTVSHIADYVIPAEYDKDKPAGASIAISASGSVVVQDGGGSISFAVSAGTRKIYNITPGHIGAYIVRNSSDEVIASGLIKPTGALRMIYLQDAVNVRDLGGWACDGGTVKYGKLFRGSRLFRSGDLNSYDIATLHDLLGIRHELDLRYDNEIDYRYSRIGSDVEWTHVNGAWYSLTNEGNCKAMLECVMDCAIKNRPLYFHCAGGADRTGTLALMIEAILGMSQSDIDKDYELTTFHSGIGSDEEARRRNETEWTSLVSAFNSYSGMSFRDKVVNWMLSLGITIDKINAFRAAMIDGMPATLDISAGVVSIAKTLSGVSADNTSVNTAKYQPYSTKLTPDNGKAIASIQVLMGGTDITEQVYSGKKCIMRHFVTINLTNCSVDNSRAKVIDGECYYCKLTPDTGYTLEGGTITITMGGVNMSGYYENGEIHIPKVTGQIVINAEAVPCAPAYTNQITQSKAEIGGSAIYNGTGYKNGYRYNSSMEERENSGSFTTGCIPVQQGDIVRLYGNIVSGNSGSLNIGFYNAAGTLKHSITPYSMMSQPSVPFMEPYNYSGGALLSFTVAESGIAYIKFTCVGTFFDGATVITVNEEV